jgi:uncharacterized NAD(P)/FAD-binding protein YdhS
MLRAVRSLARDAEAAGGDWREAINFVRGVAPNLWQRMSIADRARFLRHVRPYWDVHRHRLPEAALTRITHLMHTSRLHVHAGRLEALEPHTDGVRVQWRPRGQDTRRHVVVDRVVNCTGPDYNLKRARDPLLQSLVRDGLVVPDPLGLGLRTGVNGAIISITSARCCGPITGRRRPQRNLPATPHRSQCICPEGTCLISSRDGLPPPC